MKLYLLILISIITLACSDSSSSGNSDYNAGYEAIKDIAVETVSRDSESISVSDEIFEQKLIKESYLRFETQDLSKSYNNVIKIIKENKGFIQNDQSTKSYNRTYRKLTIRIPTQNFQKAIDSIESQVAYFEEKRISSKDVTEEFIDLEARLEAKKILEKRYLELLSKAKNVKEILDIERELSKIREEIEAKQGRLKYLNNRVSLSTLNIEFYKVTSETGVTVSYGSKMWNAVKSGFNGLSLLFLGLLHIWPFIVVIIVTFFLLRRWYNKKQKKQ